MADEHADVLRVGERAACPGREETIGWPHIDANAPGLAFAAAVISDSQAIIFRAFAGYADAASDRPLKLRFAVPIDPDSTGSSEWLDFLQYGTPTGFVPVRNIELDMPGGFEKSLDEGTIRVLPASGASTLDWELSVLPEASDEPLATVTVAGSAATRAPNGGGANMTAQDPTGCIKLTDQITIAEGRHHVTVTWSFPIGRLVRDALPVARFIAHLHAPNRLSLGIPGGAAIAAPQPIKGDRDENTQAWLDALEDLSAIQRKSVQRLVVPAIDVVAEQANDWGKTAALLRGDTLTMPWDGVLIMEGKPAETEGFPAEGELAEMSAETAFEVAVGDQTFDLGSLWLSTGAVSVQSVEPVQNGRCRATLVPINGPGLLTLRHRQ